VLHELPAAIMYTRTLRSLVATHGIGTGVDMNEAPPSSTDSFEGGEFFLHSLDWDAHNQRGSDLPGNDIEQQHHFMHGLVSCLLQLLPGTSQQQTSEEFYLTYEAPVLYPSFRMVVSGPDGGSSVLFRAKGMFHGGPWYDFVSCLVAEEEKASWSW
jgi:hypothetical protein